MNQEETASRWFPPLAKRRKEASKMQIVKNDVKMPSVIEQVLMQGDLSKLTSEQKVTYYNKTCETLGLNPLTRPFDYIRLNGREVLYARKDATEQLRKIHGVSIRITRAEAVGGIFLVVAEATDKTGRVDASTGAVPIEGLKGDALANSYLKCETKAKRRVTLSICGLGMLDETEVDSIPEARAQKVVATAQIEASELGSDDGPTEEVEQALGDYVVKVGKKLAGQQLKDVPETDLEGYLQWIEKEKTKKTVSPELQELLEMGRAYLEEKRDMGSIPF